MLLLVGGVLPLYAVLAPLYRWLLADQPLVAGWVRGFDPRLALLAFRTDVSARALPLATAGLVLACGLGFAATGDPWLYGFRGDAPGDWVWTLWLSLFLHAVFEHLAGNLLFLVPLAAALEGRLARGRLVALFRGAGVAGNLAPGRDRIRGAAGRRCGMPPGVILPGSPGGRGLVPRPPRSRVSCRPPWRRAGTRRRRR